jgi:multidrug efflux pump subunit AcrB
MMARMREIPGIVDVDSDFEVGMPEVNVEPDRKRAADAGVDMAAIGRTVGALIGGIDVAKFKDRGKRYDVRLRLVADQRTTPDDIGKLYVRNTRGDLIPVRDVTRIDERPSLQVISRRDRQRAISVFANLTPGKAQAEALDQIQRIATEILPEGYRIVLSGSSQAFQESFSSLLFALFLGIAVAYMILGAQFNHFAHPFTVLTALPFSFTGAILALWITGNTLNIYSMIGIILLMGLVKKNSIILVDFTNQLRTEGRSRDEALLTACPIRLRPILMTSTSTIVGAIPACLALGPGAETRIPMGITVVGGIIFSTALTLFVVPAVYTLLDDLTERLRKER